MTTFTKSTALAVLLAMTAASPTLAFSGATSFAPGGNGPEDPDFPDIDLPISIGAPEFAGDNRGAGPGTNSCPGGEMVLSYETDDSGHPIASTFSRECVLLR